MPVISSLYAEDGRHENSQAFFKFITRFTDAAITSKYLPSNKFEYNEYTLITTNYWKVAMLCNAHKYPIIKHNGIYETIVNISNKKTILRR